MTIENKSNKAEILIASFLDEMFLTFSRNFFYSIVWSSASETKVPARGKALVPTDLSIAVPEGTYARVGR